MTPILDHGYIPPSSRSTSLRLESRCWRFPLILSLERESGWFSASKKANEVI